MEDSNRNHNKNVYRVRVNWARPLLGKTQTSGEPDLYLRPYIADTTGLT